MKKAFKNVLFVATVIAVAVFFTAWVNIIPSFWRKDVMDIVLFAGISIRTIITFLVVIIPCILFQKRIKNNIATIWLAALLPFLVWGLKSLFFIDGGPELAVKYPTYGVMLVYVSALWIESIVLEIIHKSISWHDALEDFLFSVALSVLFYGVVTIFGQTAFSANVYGMFPAVALVQLYLAGKYHTPMYRMPKKKGKHQSVEGDFEEIDL